MLEALTDPWVVGIGTAVIAGLILYFIFGVGKSTSTSHEEEPSPNVHVDILRRRHFLQLEIINTGNEDIIRFHGEIHWRQNEGMQERILNRFFGENEDPVTMHAREVRTLRRGERVYASSIPLYSVDGRIRVNITGEGVNSHKPLDYSTVVENEARDN